MISFICFVVALVLLLLAAGNVPSSRVGLFPLGMAFWLLGNMIAAGLPAQ